MVSGKRKGPRKSYQQFPIEIDENMLDSIKVSEKNASHAILVNTSKLLNQVERLENVIADVDSLSNLSLERGESVSSTAFNSTLSNELDQNSEVSDLGFGNMIENHQTDRSGEWMACWDDFHMRTYFYNFKTEESTWDRPLGMEYLVYCSNIADEPTSTVDGLAELGNYQSNKYDLQVVSQEVLPSISKYWCQRSIHVPAIDIDPNKIDYARHNAELYMALITTIDFVKGDSFSLAPYLKVQKELLK